MTDWTSLNYVVVDVEGNGQQPPDLVELAAVPIVGGVIGEVASWIVRPDKPVTSFARRIHGITNEELEYTDTFAEVQESVRVALRADALIAHNAHVDVAVLQRKMTGWEPPEVFDTLKLARLLLPGAGGYKLGNLVERFNLAEGLPDDITPHRAEYDALVAARLFITLATKAATLEELRGESPGGGEDEPPALF